jgi:hypothetical protein
MIVGKSPGLRQTEEETMPLRDHFRAPLDLKTSWDGFHGTWPGIIAISLNRQLPSRFVAAPTIHVGAFTEIDVATLAEDEPDLSTWTDHGNGGVATAVWAPPRATLTIPTELPAQDEYEVRVYDERRSRRLVAAIEIVSPANKDRPENRHAFAAKCAALLQKQVCVAIVDLVTTRQFNLYAETLELIGHADPLMTSDGPFLYAIACRTTKKNDAWQLESWAYPLTLGALLPALPLWLADDYAVRVDLESSYEETCRGLRIP